MFRSAGSTPTVSAITRGAFCELHDADDGRRGKGADGRMPVHGDGVEDSTRAQLDREPVKGFTRAACRAWRMPQEPAIGALLHAQLLMLLVWSSEDFGAVC